MVEEERRGEEKDGLGGRLKESPWAKSLSSANAAVVEPITRMRGGERGTGGGRTRERREKKGMGWASKYIWGRTEETVGSQKTEVEVLNCSQETGGDPGRLRERGRVFKYQGRYCTTGEQIRLLTAFVTEKRAKFRKLRDGGENNGRYVISGGGRKWKAKGGSSGVEERY